MNYTIGRFSSQGFSFGRVRFDTGMDMGLEGGFAGEEKFLTDTGEFVAGTN